MPERIQLRRTKGWRKPAGAIYVGRQTQWGNPFPTVDGDRAAAVRLYRQWITGPRSPIHMHGLGRRWPDLAPLRGHDLACWCPLSAPCHADVLLELANQEDTP